MSETVIGQTWNAQQYAAKGRFVADLAAGVVDLLAVQPGDRILDLGCGDGALTEELRRRGATVVGVDASAEMLEAARARGLEVVRANAESLPFTDMFDAVFSNAALHWIRNQRAVMEGVYRALRPGGRFVAEMGGIGNIAAIRVALQAVLKQYGIDAEEAAASFYPSPAEYRGLLQQAGFTVRSMELIPRPTALPAGMDGWLETFRNGVLDRLGAEERVAALRDTINLLRPVLEDSEGNWTADYVRLRFVAVRRER